MRKNFNPIIPTDDDGLVIHEAHIWTEEKYKLVGGYNDIFTRGMRKKWKKLVYVDLFAGPGYCRIIETGRILKSSPMIALSLPLPFDFYIFCDENEKFIDALKRRVDRDHSDKAVHFYVGDCNNGIEDIKKMVPVHKSGETVLTFCFIDPYELNFHFETIKRLTENKLVDVLILQAYFMDLNRNYTNYLNDDNQKISLYLDDEKWREKFKKSAHYPKNFVRFIAESYDEKMRGLNYLNPIRNSIKIPDKNVRLYYLSFYSKHERGQDFYKKVQEYSDEQLTMRL